MEIDLPFRYWGKASPPDNTAADKYHLLPYHSLDVAACGWLLLAEDYPWVTRLSQALGITDEQLRRLFVFFLCLHDIGKFSRAFQGLAGALSAELVTPVAGMAYSERHDSLGFWLWKDAEQLHAIFAHFWGLTPQQVRVNRQLRVWFEIATGHHGQPPKLQSQLLSEYFTEQDIAAAGDFVSHMLDLWLQPDDVVLLQDKTVTAKLVHHSWTLAGLTVLADWQGSHQRYFPYCSKVMPLTEYWQQHALPGARQAIAQMGLQPGRIAPFNRIQQLFPFIEQPTPLQHYAIAQPLPAVPQLLILEDVTGAGKTEAAMVLVHRLMSQGLADGLYIGLPTMATANAMYQRMAACYSQLYQPDQQVSLVLAHGARHLSSAFMQSVAAQSPDINYQQDEPSASTYCNHWFADSRKKALLADVGVGTLDQVLLGVLPARHQSLRMLGLGRKVLLVDEVHAYDAYMTVLLASVLEMHARQGGSAILLSATLPQQMKNQLFTAYAKGREESPPLLTSEAYPLATQWPGVTAQLESPLSTRAAVKRRIKVERLTHSEDVYALLQEAVAAGRCVCWIRNTVDEARDSYQVLSQLLAGQASGVHLFHSRFAMVDRQRIENAVLEWFGKHSRGQQRAGRVLIATQVVEQSLDLDFDVLVTDLAPIDLLLQRAGRLHRHTRDQQGDPVTDGSAECRPAAILYVLAPEPTEQADQHWLSAFSGTLAVYRDLGQLWRSARVLFEQGEYAMPEDARQLIENVYSPDTLLNTPAAIEQVSLAAEGERRAQADQGRFNRLKLHAGYSRNSNDSNWGEEVAVPTRLSDKSVSMVLVKPAESGGWQPYADHAGFAWDLSALQIRESLWHEAEREIPPQLQHTLQQLQQQTSALRWFTLFPLVGALAQWYHPEQGWLGRKGEKQ